MKSIRVIGVLGDKKTIGKKITQPNASNFNAVMGFDDAVALSGLQFKRPNKLVGIFACVNFVFPAFLDRCDQVAVGFTSRVYRKPLNIVPLADLCIIDQNMILVSIGLCVVSPYVTHVFLCDIKVAQIVICHASLYYIVRAMVKF